MEVRLLSLDFYRKYENNMGNRQKDHVFVKAVDNLRYEIM